MSRFNTAAAKTVARSPVTSEAVPSGTTYEGAPGYARDTKSELFLLAVAYMGSDATFYETGKERDSRFADLVRKVAVEDPAWTDGFIPWLRSGANMRTASLVAAAEALKARLDAKLPGGRALVSAALQRADEPGELLAYWHSLYGRNEPKPLKRGIADAVLRLYSEYCVAPETLILRDDMRWVPAAELQEADLLVGFDESLGVNSGRGGTRLRSAAIEAIGRKDLECVRVVTDRGEIVVSLGHQFVEKRSRNRYWKVASDVHVGDHLLWIGEPWEDISATRDAAYMAGLIDGEGWLSGAQGRARIGFAQNAGLVWEESLACLKRLGFEPVIAARASGVQTWHVVGGRYETMRFLGQVRSVRLIDRAREIWEGGTLVSKGPYTQAGASIATVVAVEKLGVRPVVTMQTSTRTFIANGYLSHNSLLKYDTDSHGYRFGDVIERVHVTGEHPEVKGTWRGALYEHAIDRRHGRANDVPEALGMIRANAALRKRAAEDPRALLDAAALKAAGMTWEDVLSLAGSKVAKQDLWAALIPSMGFMAHLRNLRNLDDAGVPDEVAGDVIARLTDPEQVAKSRQFPFRFLSAYRAAPSLRWAYPLERALNLSLANVPALKGRSLILIDRSLSMWQAKMSGRSEMLWADAAAVFGVAVAQRAERADLVEFSSRAARVEFRSADSVLKIIERLHVGDNPHSVIGTGTDIPRAVRENLRADHSRVVIVTDEQSEAGVLPSNIYGHPFSDAAAMPSTRIDDLIPQSVPVYVWNIGGYKHGALPSGAGQRHTFGGLTDSAFRMINLLEAGHDCRWPWED